jgi:hypothetical protein
VSTRFDLTFAASLLSRRLDFPDIYDIMQLKHCLRYIRNSLDLGISLKMSHPRLSAACDADWAGDSSSLKLTSGHVVYFGLSPVSWSLR